MRVPHRSDITRDIAYAPATLWPGYPDDTIDRFEKHVPFSCTALRISRGTTWNSSFDDFMLST